MKRIYPYILACPLLVFLLDTVSVVHALANEPRTSNHARNQPTHVQVLGRRAWLERGLVSAGMAVATGVPLLISHSPPAWAESSFSPEREALLKAIGSRLGEEDVLKCIDNLMIATHSSKPSNSQSTNDRIDGQWKLIWSMKDENFSPLLRFPGPLKPTSYQYAGSAAAPIVGEGRVAQMLTNGILGPNKAWLSSGIVDYDGVSFSNTLQILPPFRLELETPVTTPTRQVLVEAGSDEDFRAANARSLRAQLAPPNLYQQLYIEENGPGSLRISKIVEGDPVIVGATFVHVKL